jgi:hypothetical protein
VDAFLHGKSSFFSPSLRVWEAGGGDESTRLKEWTGSWLVHFYYFLLVQKEDGLNNKLAIRFFLPFFHGLTQ